MAEPLLKTTGLHVEFAVQRHQVLSALDDISFTINESSIVGLVGESGSGKSTLGRTLIGLEKASAGEIFIEGQQLPRKFCHRDHLLYAKKMQMVFQDPYTALNPRLNIADSLLEPLKLIDRLSPGELRKEAEQWMNRIGLPVSYLNLYPHELSGGQCQRICIARALIIKPSLVICDEAISALDVSIQAQIVELLKNLREELRMSLLFIAHDLPMVHFLCDEIIVMYAGKIVEQGSADEIFFQARHPYTRALLAAHPTLSSSCPEMTSNPDIGGEFHPQIYKTGKKPTSCNFADRCAFATQRCRTEIPLEQYITSTHRLSCHHPIPPTPPQQG